MKRNQLWLSLGVTATLASVIYYTSSFDNNAQSSPEGRSLTPEKDSATISLIDDSGNLAKNDSSARFDFLLDYGVRPKIQLERLQKTDFQALSQSEIDALFHHLLTHQPESQQESAWFLVANEIMELIRRRGVGTDQLSKNLLTLIRAEETPPTLRDYAVQHLGQWVNPVEAYPDAPHEEDPALIAEVETALVDIILNPEYAEIGTAGTALIALTQMKRESITSESLLADGSPLREWIGQTVAESSATRTNRASAIYHAGLFGLKELRAPIRQLAESDVIDPTLRLNAIVSLGYLGDPEDHQFLQSLSESTHQHRYAARSSLRRLVKQ